MGERGGSKENECGAEVENRDVCEGRWSSDVRIKNDGRRTTAGERPVLVLVLFVKHQTKLFLFRLSYVWPFWTLTPPCHCDVFLTAFKALVKKNMWWIPDESVFVVKCNHFQPIKTIRLRAEETPMRDGKIITSHFIKLMKSVCKMWS